MQVLGGYNQQLSALLAHAEQQWPALCAEEDEPTAPEIEKRRQALLLALTYLDHLQQLLDRQADQHKATAFPGSHVSLPPGIDSAA